MSICMKPKDVAFGVRNWVRRLHALDREALAALYLRGEGIEIGALHCPLRLPRSAHVRYLDRWPVERLRELYPEVSSGNPLPQVDILDDGEKLGQVAAGSQDFVIANHFLEHCQDPVCTIENFLRVLKPGGLAFLAVPDKRQTFDADRPVTGTLHLLHDYRNGPQGSLEEHLEEWVRVVEKVHDPSAVAARVEQLKQTGYAVHYHVWDDAALLAFIALVRGFFPMELEAFVRHRAEFIFLLRKPGGAA